MKKIFISSILLMMTAIMFAATHDWTNVITVKLIDGNSDTYQSRFGEATDISNDPTDLYSPVTANFEGATVKAYVKFNNNNYEQLYLNAFEENTPLIVKTYNSTSLTFDLKANYGTVSLYDNVTGTITTVDKTTNPTNAYVCTVPMNATISNRFFIFYNAASFAYAVTLNSYGWASFSCNEDVELSTPAGLKAYKGTLNAAGNELQLNEVDDIAANMGVILYGTPSTTYYLVPTTATADFAGNALKASVDWTSNTGNIYVLHDEALYQYTGSDMPANKAYLQISSGPNPAPKHIRMVINGTTAVDNVEAEAVKAEKLVEDGQVYIRRGNEVYNLQGQKVNF